jgi:hypothetical protein
LNGERYTFGVIEWIKKYFSLNGFFGFGVLGYLGGGWVGVAGGRR